MKKVLVVEDSQEIQIGLAMNLLDVGVEALSVFTLEQAYEIFDKHPDDLDAIALDGCVPGNDLNTLPLIHHMRRTFRGPMIAMSSNSDFRIEMLSAGCDYACTKDRLVRKICEIFGLNPPADPLF